MPGTDGEAVGVHAKGCFAHLQIEMSCPGERRRAGDFPRPGAVDRAIGRGVVSGCSGVGPSSGCFFEMPDADEAVGPDVGGVLLVGGGGLAVVDVEHGVGRAGDGGHVHPGGEQVAVGIVAFDFMRDLRLAVGGSEEDVVAIGLGVGEEGGLDVRLGDEHGESRVAPGHLRRGDGDHLPIRPGLVPVVLGPEAADDSEAKQQRAQTFHGKKTSWFGIDSGNTTLVW